MFVRACVRACSALNVKTLANPEAFLQNVYAQLLNIHTKAIQGNTND